MTICSIPDCSKRTHARGWCSMHLSRWQSNGDPLVSRKDPETRFTKHTRWDGECLVWAAGLSPRGYGRFSLNGKAVRAHRYAWERVHGPIPEGMEVDHICHNTSCVNVAHLRLATSQENKRNRNGAQRGSRLGIRGVTLDRGRYRARYWIGGEQIDAGFFATAAEAERAVTRARAEAFGEFAGKGR